VRQRRKPMPIPLSKPSSGTRAFGRRNRERDATGIAISTERTRQGTGQAAMPQSETREGADWVARSSRSPIRRRKKRGPLGSASDLRSVTASEPAQAQSGNRFGELYSLDIGLKWSVGVTWLECQREIPMPQGVGTERAVPASWSERAGSARDHRKVAASATCTNSPAVAASDGRELGNEPATALSRDRDRAIHDARLSARTVRCRPGRTPACTPKRRPHPEHRTMSASRVAVRWCASARRVGREIARCPQQGAIPKPRGPASARSPARELEHSKTELATT
jgi:hypothetical protein